MGGGRERDEREMVRERGEERERRGRREGSDTCTRNMIASQIVQLYNIFIIVIPEVNERLIDPLASITLY